MKSSLQKLHKFFKLEAERGYDNRAVVGGLERMLAPWEAEARLEGLPDHLIEAVVSRLRDYYRLTESSRQDALQGLWQRIQRELELAPQPLPANERKETPKVSPPAPESKSPDEAKPEQPQTLPQSDTAVLADHAQVPEKPPSPKSDQTPAALNAPVTVLTGVGPRHAQTLSRLGLHTLGDMLYFFPRRYDD